MMVEEKKRNKNLDFGELMQEMVDKGRLTQQDDGSFILKGHSGEVKIGLKEKEKSIEEIKSILGDVYENIIQVLKEYTDLKQEYYPIISVWIIGTYLHNSFNTYPYLFINAMRGSGKTRLLRLIASMSSNGKVLLSPTEAVMFRIPKGNTICIDEFEGMMRKENAGLREMLNACYKKGTTVFRMKQRKNLFGTEQVVEEFEPYKPICMANIWGIEEVLGDRCIPIIIEKSAQNDIMRYIEDFENKPMINDIKCRLSNILVQLCSSVDIIGGIEKWNLYVKQKYSTLDTYTTQTTQTTQTTLQEKDLEIFNKIDSAGIKGRNLELFFPLMNIASFIGEEVLEIIVNLAKDLDSAKKKEEMMESKDVSLIDFISQQNTEIGYKSIRNLTITFRNFLGNVEDSDDKWINERWLGKALSRLNLYTDKRRVASGIEVILNIEKAKEKLKIFK
jgi:hypothetical protein